MLCQSTIHSAVRPPAFRAREVGGAAVRGVETGGAVASSLRARGIRVAAATSPRVATASGVRRIHPASAGAIRHQPPLRSVRTGPRLRPPLVLPRSSCAATRVVRTDDGALARTPVQSPSGRGERRRHELEPPWVGREPLAGGVTAVRGGGRQSPRRGPCAWKRTGTLSRRSPARNPPGWDATRPAPDRIAPDLRRGIAGVKRGHRGPFLGLPANPASGAAPQG